MDIKIGQRVSKETAKQIEQIKECLAKQMEMADTAPNEEARRYLYDGIVAQKIKLLKDTGINIDTATVEVHPDPNDDSLFIINATMELPPGTRMCKDEDGNIVLKSIYEPEEIEIK
jgi:hypothetical protein